MAVEDITTKLCTKCGEAKPLGEFHKNSASRDGLRSQCKVCHNAANAKWREDNPEKYRESVAKWETANPDKRREVSAKWRKANPEKQREYRAKWYADNKEYFSKRRAENPEKGREAAAKWRESNPEKAREGVSKWRRANPEAVRAHDHNYRARKRKNGGKLSKGIAGKLFKLQRGKCACCGKPLGDDYHLDHIMPLALGGSNTDNNIQLLRAECNLHKHAKHPVEFMQSKGKLL